MGQIAETEPADLEIPDVAMAAATQITAIHSAHAEFWLRLALVDPSFPCHK